jgi:Tol biopolymer transport system component
LSISPDGTRIAIVLGGGALSVIDVTGGGAIPVALDAVERPATWSPDSKRIAYTSNRASGPGIYAKSSDGQGREEQLFAPVPGNMWNWSGDGRFLTLTIANNFAALSTSGDGGIVTIAPTVGKSSLRMSPDSAFVAYVSNEAGSNQVFVRSFAPSDPGGFFQRQITTEGAVSMVRWRADGKELYYLAPDGGVMAAPIGPAPQLNAGPPVLLFRAPPGFQIAVSSGAAADVSADGQRFAFLVPVEPNAPR